MTPATTFIYALSDPQSGEIRYIGKADSPNKRWKDHLDAAGRPKEYSGYWIRSLLRKGLRPELRILEEIPFIRWQEIERNYIRLARLIGMNLVNTAEGGRGVMYGRRHSAATREKISAVKTGRPGHKPSPETLEKLRAFQGGPNNVHRGKKASLETRARMSASHTGKIVSLATREKLSVANKNCKPPDHTGRKRSSETIARMRLSRLGKKPTIETRIKMSAAQVRKHQERKIKNGA